jgi:phage gpG-like protein
MATIGLKVDTKEAELMLEALVEAVEDFSPVWPKVERIIMDMERQQFKTEGKFGGEEWAPLNESYAEYKRKVYGSKGILVASGTMMQSLTSKGQGHYMNSGPNFVEVGTTIPYAGYHQRGHETPTKLPKRTVVPMPPKPTGQDIADAIMAFMVLRMRQNTRGK